MRIHPIFLIFVPLSLFIWAIAHQVSDDNACQHKGGVNIRTASGYQCVKAETLP
jgi:hypothetical protein